jgi:antitoxin (DNA-binding transcriptional repressor) of toxin-antitoxin stability system
MPSRAVSIADLKANLSAHLERVRSGEELLIRDRRTTIAKIIPLAVTEDVSADEVALAAEGKVRLPTKRLPASFWKTSGPRVATDRALETATPAERAFWDASGIVLRVLPPAR